VQNLVQTFCPGRSGLFFSSKTFAMPYAKWILNNVNCKWRYIQVRVVKILVFSKNNPVRLGEGVFIVFAKQYFKNKASCVFMLAQVVITDFGYLGMRIVGMVHRLVPHD
jgi:hypothetical protein